MYSKIAFKNVKKSFKDYTIYFFTLTLAVCIFYSFNSIESQKALIEMNSSTNESVALLLNMISLVSVFVACILGCLILYANNFLIKKRNKEMGIYMTLGMSKNKISKILILETLIVGIMSLISGLLLGFLTSQGLSVLTTKLFEVKMTSYAFTISTQAIVKTILYFGVMFLLVMIFNSFVISKYRIIDLLTVSRKTEDIKFKNPIVYLIAFILCVISLVVAYKLVLEVGILGIAGVKFKISIALGIIGTILFFFSLAGFILYIAKKNKKVYFKGLNIFVIKQINSKINTNFISMSVICLMLFLTIGTLSTGFSIKDALESGLKDTTPFDASADIYIPSQHQKAKDIKKSLGYIGVQFDKNDKVVYYNEYRDGKKVSDIITSEKNNKDLGYSVYYMKISDYNKIREINNQEKIDLNKDEVIATSSISKILPVLEKYAKDNGSIQINGNDYNIKNKEVIKDNIKTSYIQNNPLTIIVNDEVCSNMELCTSNVSINFTGKDKDKKAKDFNEKIESYKTEGTDYEKIGYVSSATRNSVYEENKGLATTLLFVGIYIGIVFLISSMAVLALQQLSEASDSIDRYKSLKRLGASTKDINKTIFTQTLVYFSVPVALALVHSVVGIKVANDFISIYNSPNIVSSSLITAGIFLIIYTIYFYITYGGYKNIVKNNI